jgi:sulfide:quinone oxidoreductase
MGEGSSSTRVLVLGAGFGGLEVATLLSARAEESVEVVVVDRAEGFVFGYSKLDVMFGHRLEEQVFHPYADLVGPGLRFVRSEIREIDVHAKTVRTDEGVLEADVLVVALGAEVDPAATPGLVEAGHEFYSNKGAFAMRDVLTQFQGGHVVVGVTGTPYKCPPAPSEAALLVDEHLRKRGLRERSTITLVTPMPSPVPPAPDASKAILEAFDERGISFHPGLPVTHLDPERRVAVAGAGEEFAFDLFLGVPRHRAPQVVVDSGLAVDGWVPVDPRTLETQVPDVYAIGDMTSAGTPKAGIFAEGHAAVVADRILDRLAGREPTAEYGGNGICYIGFGEDLVATADVTFLPGQAPFGAFEPPSTQIAARKVAFGADRVRRWFGREWAHA